MADDHPPPEVVYGEWRGGKPPGSVTARKGPHGKIYSWVYACPGQATVSFASSKHGGEEHAKAAAETHQRISAEEEGFLFKNQYRFCVSPDGGEFLQFHVRNAKGVDFYPTCDVDNLPLVEANVWNVALQGRSTYVITNIKVGDKWPRHYFHRMVSPPEWPEVDHYPDRSGLNNQRKNLRDGSGGVNGRNRSKRVTSAPSKVTGVGYYNGHWVAYIGSGKDLRRESFAGPEDKNHESYQAAYALRKEWEDELGYTNG